MPRHVSTPSRPILILAMLAVIFHALMPLLMALPTGVGVEMPMCSTLGAKSVFVSFDTAPKPASGKGLQARCPLCLAGAHFALVPPEEARPALLLGLCQVQIAASAPGLMPTLIGPPYRSRAPPRV